MLAFFTASMVLIWLMVKRTKETVWMNSYSSPQKCNIPIMIQYAKETKELISSEIKNIKTSAQKLRLAKVITTNGVCIDITDMKLTMLEGKVSIGITDIPPSSTCYICKATSSEINDLERIQQKKEIVSIF